VNDFIKENSMFLSIPQKPAALLFTCLWAGLWAGEVSHREHLPQLAFSTARSGELVMVQSTQVDDEFLFRQVVSAHFNSNQLYWKMELTSESAISEVFLTRSSDGGILAGGVYEGNLRVGHEQIGTNGGRDIFLFKTNPEGELLWLRSLGGSGDEHLLGLIEAPPRQLGLRVFSETGMTSNHQTLIDTHSGEQVILLNEMGDAHAVYPVRHVPEDSASSFNQQTMEMRNPELPRRRRGSDTIVDGSLPPDHPTPIGTGNPDGG
jgi:hypothetical protein